MILSEMGEARWLTPDPAGRAAVNLSNPRSWNAYAHVLNNPTTLTDPSGLHGECSSEVSNGNGGCQGAAIPGALDKETQTGTALTNKHHSSNPVNSTQQKINKDKIVDTMDKNAHGTNTYNGYCATACRKGLQAGGVKVPLVNGHRYPNANEYGPVLLKNGASIVPQKGYVPQKGDVVVFQGGGPHDHPSGHIAIYDGKQWVSDTRQAQMAPNRSGYPGGYTIYRFPN